MFSIFAVFDLLFLSDRLLDGNELIGSIPSTIGLVHTVEVL